METKINVSSISSRELSDDPLRELIAHGARQLIQQAVNIELEALLESFKDRKTEDGKQAVVRNGHLPEREVLTGVGPVSVKIPKVRSRDGRPVTFRSELVPPYVRKTKSVEAALPWLYLKGVSTGEMESTLEVLLGKDAEGLSASVVSKLKSKWIEEYKEWGKRDISTDNWVYIWADGVYSSVRGDNPNLCVLVVIGLNERGEKKLLAIEDGMRESSQSWRELLLDLKNRGLGIPKLAIGDGAMGFWKAVSEVLPMTKQQRCWMHKTGNVLNYLPKSSRPKAKSRIHEIWQAETKEAAIKAFDLFIATYDDKYPKATNCLEKDRESLLTFFDFPAKHWPSIRTTNPIESTFGTIRHRQKRSKGCLSRDGVLSMIFKLGLCAEKRWRRIRGFDYVGKVIEGINFRDGIEVKKLDRKAA